MPVVMGAVVGTVVAVWLGYFVDTNGPLGALGALAVPAYWLSHLLVGIFSLDAKNSRLYLVAWFVYWPVLGALIGVLLRFAYRSVRSRRRDARG
jgi:ABC-type dipeptide/oligopeptide/nickel transport system permease component